jgi:tetratricopeptide (TPR) repeat protein
MRPVALLIVLLLAACAGRAPLLNPERDGAALELSDTPFFPQQQYQCGPAALATVLTASGVAVTPEELVPRVYLPARRGSLQAELIATARTHDRLPYPIGPSLDELLAELRAGRPGLVLQNLGLESAPIWHYAVVIGFEPESDRLILRSGVTEREILPVRRFLATWRRAGSWGLVMLMPGELPARPDPQRYLRAVAALEATDRPGAAGKAYSAALSIWPENALARFGLANSHYAQGDYRQAEALYQGILERQPDHAPSYHNLARTLAAQGCRGQALEWLETGRAFADPGLAEVFERTRAAITEQAGQSDAGSGCVRE